MNKSVSIKTRSTTKSSLFKQAISEFSSASVSKRVYVRNLSYENEFCMQFHFHTNKSHFHENGFALRLALKQRHNGTRKWPITLRTVLLLLSSSSVTVNKALLPRLSTKGFRASFFSRGFLSRHAGGTTSETMFNWQGCHRSGTRQAK